MEIQITIWEFVFPFVDGKNKTYKITLRTNLKMNFVTKIVTRKLDIWYLL